ncbi:MAG TPA: quinol:electron acceptor oxidoreductase subunit ActD [Bryobacteraceae bacterium]|nr:quinol:electron acceptor oxidoreductase subunit ActD [Bryobacteraceae bacterium]
MPAKNISVFGIYPDQLTAEDAVDSLRDSGFRSTDISVLFPDNQGTKDFAHEKHTKAPEMAVAAGSSGAVIGGALGWLAGIGALAIPGAGPFIAAGPIMGMLGGIGVGTTVGGVAGALIGFGIPEYEAKRYEGRIRRGSILLSVHCDDPDWAKRARNVLTQTGAEDVGATGEARADFAATDKPMKRTENVYSVPQSEI